MIIRPQEYRTPGALGDVPLHQPLPCRPPGGIGQFTLLNHPFTFIGDKSQSDRFEWPVDQLSAYLEFDWADGDDTDPDTGPTLTKSGTPTPGKETPWQLRDGSIITASHFDPTTDYYTTSTPIDLPTTWDMIVTILAFFVPNGVLHTMIGTRKTSSGWMLFQQTGGEVDIRAQDAVGSVTTSTIDAVLGWALISVTYDASGNMVVYLNGDQKGSAVVSGLGSISSGQGIGLNARTDGSLCGRSYITRAMFWYGAGIAEIANADWHARLASCVLGIEPIQGARGSFARNSATSWQNKNGIWAIGSIGMPRSGDSGGLRAAPGRTNKAYKNIDPQTGDAAAALTWTGAKAPTEVDDSTALAAVDNDASAWGPNVFEYDNDTGSTQYIRASATTGTTNAHSLQCLVRVVSGTGTVKLGLYDESAGTFSGSAISDGYNSRTIIDGQTPGDTDCTLCLEVPDGITIRWIAHDMSEGATCQTPIPNYATAAQATRPQDVLTTTYTPDDRQGSIEAKITPMGFDGADFGTSTIINRSGGAGRVIYKAGNYLGFYDGTSLVTSPVAMANGIEQHARSRWTEGAGMSITVDEDRDSDSYDGDLFATGAVEVETSLAEVQIKELRAYRNGSG